MSGRDPVREGADRPLDGDNAGRSHGPLGSQGREGGDVSKMEFLTSLPSDYLSGLVNYQKQIIPPKINFKLCKFNTFASYSKDVRLPVQLQRAMILLYNIVKMSVYQSSCREL